MIYIENDWSDLEEGMRRALRERDALVAHALAVAQAKASGGIVGRLEALERERCELQTEIARQTADRIRRERARAQAGRQALDRTKTAQLVLGLFGLIPAGAVMALGLVGVLLTAPLEVIGLYFTEGRDLGRFMGWPVVAAGLGCATVLLGIVGIAFLSLAMRQEADEASIAVRRLTGRLGEVQAELDRVRRDVEAKVESDVQDLLPPEAPDVDVFGLWVQRLGGAYRGDQTPPEEPDGNAGSGRFFQALDRELPRSVIALRNVSVGPELDVDLILIGNARVWLLQYNALAGTMRHVNGAWARNEPGATRIERTVIHTSDFVGQLAEAQRFVLATLNQTFRRKGFREMVCVQSGIVFTHPEARLLGLGASPLNYGDVSWWTARLIRDFGAAARNRSHPDRLAFKIADALLDAQVGATEFRQLPSPGVASSIFEEQWVALETWLDATVRSA